MAGDALTNQNTLAVLGLAEPSVGKRLGEVLGHLEALAGAAGAQFLNVSDLFEDAPFVIGDVLSSGIAALQKRSLIIGGGALEGAVTQTAIHTLMDGYDVFVPADLCVGVDEALVSVHLDRIRDSGGIVTSHRQLVLELLAQTDDPAMRAPLEVLLTSL